MSVYMPKADVCRFHALYSDSKWPKGHSGVTTPSTPTTCRCFIYSETSYSAGFMSLSVSLFRFLSVTVAA